MFDRPQLRAFDAVPARRVEEVGVALLGDEESRFHRAVRSLVALFRAHLGSVLRAREEGVAEGLLSG